MTLVSTVCLFCGTSGAHLNCVDSQRTLTQPARSLPPTPETSCEVPSRLRGPAGHLITSRDSQTREWFCENSVLGKPPERPPKKRT
eukprot:805923-Amphidinium_carterae.1